jgi:hypothetical protein
VHLLRSTAHDARTWPCPADVAAAVTWGMGGELSEEAVERLLKLSGFVAAER